MADAQGVEALPGESEADYIARQTRLREEAAARMRAKFGGSGGLNGRMGGCGSSGSGFGSCSSQQNSGGSTLGSIGSVAGSAAGAAVSGLGTVAAAGFSTTSWLVGKAKESAGSVVSVVARSNSGANANADPSEEESNDISDLLASARVDRDEPQQRAAPAVRTPERTGSPMVKKKEEDIFAAAGFESVTPPRTSSPFATAEPRGSPISMAGAGEAVNGSSMGGEVTVSSPSTHVSTPSSNGLSARKKARRRQAASQRGSGVEVGGGDAGDWRGEAFATTLWPRIHGLSCNHANVRRWRRRSRTPAAGTISTVGERSDRDSSWGVTVGFAKRLRGLRR